MTPSRITVLQEIYKRFFESKWICRLEIFNNKSISVDENETTCNPIFVSKPPESKISIKISHPNIRGEKYPKYPKSNIWNIRE